MVAFRHIHRAGDGKVTGSLEGKLVGADPDVRDGEDPGLGIGFSDLDAVQPDRRLGFGLNGEREPGGAQGQVDLGGKEAILDGDDLFGVEVFGVGEADGVLAGADAGQGKAVELVGGTAWLAIEIDGGASGVGQDDDRGFGEVEQRGARNEEDQDTTKSVEPLGDGPAAGQRGFGRWQGRGGSGVRMGALGWAFIGCSILGDSWR
nr:hypothetical protein [Chloracidobacterium aggregatum]